MASLSGQQLTLPAQEGDWQKFSATWDVGSSSQAIIQIRNLCLQEQGNDFVVDDISFSAR
jgi:hypothetical protein